MVLVEKHEKVTKQLQWHKVTKLLQWHKLPVEIALSYHHIDLNDAIK